MGTWLTRTVVSAVGRTWRVEVEGRDHLDGLRDAGRAFAFALWHAQLLPLVWCHRGHPTTLLISRHGDGTHLARAAVGWGFRVVRGSSSRGGVGALRALTRVLQAGGEVGVTVDGPRGPARLAKPGVAQAAWTTGAPILPVVARAGRAWRLRSWDRFEIPYPFAPLRVAYGAPLHPAEWPDPGALTAALERRLRALDEATAC